MEDRNEGRAERIQRHGQIVVGRGRSQHPAHTMITMMLAHPPPDLSQSLEMVGGHVSTHGGGSFLLRRV